MKYRGMKSFIISVGLAALLLTPGLSYGQSVSKACGGMEVCQKIAMHRLCYELSQREKGTYCRGLECMLQREGQSLAAPKTEPEKKKADSAETESEGVAWDMLIQVNEQRRAAGLSELVLSKELSRVAQIKAEDMKNQGYFSHTSPTYGSPFDMMKAFGISYRFAGENIASGYGSVSSVMNGWMNSPGHRANILSSNYAKLGVGYCKDSDGNSYWVQMFIR